VLSKLLEEGETVASFGIFDASRNNTCAKELLEIGRRLTALCAAPTEQYSSGMDAIGVPQSELSRPNSFREIPSVVAQKKCSTGHHTTHICFIEKQFVGLPYQRPVGRPHAVRIQPALSTNHLTLQAVRASYFADLSWFPTTAWCKHTRIVLDFEEFADENVLLSTELSHMCHILR
jgi:hypothetical protein